MVLVAITYSSGFVVDILHTGEPVDSERYVQFLKKIHHSFSRRTDAISWDDWVLQHDNAWPHTSKFTTDFLNDGRDMDFNDENDVCQHITATLWDLCKDYLGYQFQKFKNDLHAIIDCGGDYF